MTLEELKQVIDNYIGLVSEVESRGNGSAELVYKSTTGVSIFNITVGNYGDSWEFGGMSGALPDSWKHLCRIHQHTEQRK